MLDLIFILEQLLCALLRLKSVLYQVLDALVLPSLGFFELLSRGGLLGIAQGLELDLHFVIGQRLLAFLHSTNVVQVLLLDSLEFSYDAWLIQIDVVLSCHSY